MRLCSFLVIFTLVGACAPRLPMDPLAHLLKKAPPALAHCIKNKDLYEVQIIYTQIERDANNTPQFYSFSFNVDDQHYFYPASTVKMPVAFLALQRINELNQHVPAIDVFDYLMIDSSRSPQTTAWVDSTNADLMPTIARYIEKIFVTSDNDAYNRLYEFLGQDYINDELKKKGIFTNSVIRTRVGISGFSTEDNKYTNGWRLIDRESNQVMAIQNEYYALYDYHLDLKNMRKGKGYFSDALDTIIMEPFDFSEKNFISLADLEKSLMRAILPNQFPADQRYNMSDEQYRWLYNAMAKKPRDFDYLTGHDEYYDSYVKFFVNGDNKNPIPEHIKIYNKVGWAYGTVTDCSYIIDTQTGAEFFLTATINVNENGIYNDGNYAYDSIAMPFFSSLGALVLKYEQQRKRQNKPTFEVLAGDQ